MERVSSALCLLTEALKEIKKSLQKNAIKKESLSALFLYF